VVKGIHSGRVLVGDPASGLQTYSRADFEAIWNGVVLAIHHAPDSTQTPIFNRDEEWRPWAVAPVREAPGPFDPAQVLRDVPEIYQIAPVRVIP
jgi:predicted double-glycine peptidase